MATQRRVQPDSPEGRLISAMHGVFRGPHGPTLHAELTAIAGQIACFGVDGKLRDDRATMFALGRQALAKELLAAAEDTALMEPEETE